MIPGYNTDITYKGVVYHVQTEDKGIRNPKVETLVFQNGTILYRKTTPYEEILNTDKQQEIIQALMEEQHQQIIKEAKQGKFHPDSQDNGLPDDKPFGIDMISKDKTLDEVILEYLSEKTKTS